MPVLMGRKTIMWFEAFATRTFYFTGFAAEMFKAQGTDRDNVYKAYTV